MTSPSASEVKACCASAYASAAARWLLGESFHPGGAALTSRLVGALGVAPGSVVLDVASGPGTSALQLAREAGCDAVGVDLSGESVAQAQAAAEEAGLAGSVRFVRGDAEDLPFLDASFDGAICECSFCTFPDKATAAAQLARVLRPNARLALSDVTAKPEALPAELRTLDAWIACLADARPLAETAGLLERAGFAVEETEEHDAALVELLDRVDGRLRPLGIGVRLLDAARQAVADGTLGYGVVVARRRGSGLPASSPAAAASSATAIPIAAAAVEPPNTS